MNLRIVRTRRGDLITGFRVQKETLRFLRDENNHVVDRTYQWRNTGKKCYSMDEAREYMGWLQKFDTRAEETVEPVEGFTSDPGPKYQAESRHIPFSDLMR